ncbi:hypothetical protein EON65_56500, partial [archaeon]
MAEMDVLTFNTSPNLVETIGNATSRYSVVSSHGNTETYIVSVGGLRGPSPASADHHDKSKIRHSCHNHLQVDVLDIKNAVWKPEYIVTNGIRNRAHHGLVTVKQHSVHTISSSPGADEHKAEGPPAQPKDVILMFGGGVLDMAPRSSSYSLLGVGDVVKIEKSLFGFVANTFYEDEGRKLDYIGMSASAVGKQSDRVMLFGGQNVRGFN